LTAVHSFAPRSVSETELGTALRTNDRRLPGPPGWVGKFNYVEKSENRTATQIMS